MNDANNHHPPAPHSSVPTSRPRGSWTSRIILWTLACVIGLWLGMGTHNVTAGGHKNRPSAGTQAALADVFRFDILLAGKASAAEPVRPKPAPETKCNLPAAFLVAMEQRPEPVYSVMPKTLSGTRPHFMIAPPSRPAGPWPIQVSANMAQWEQSKKQMQAALAIIPGISAAERKSIRAEVDNACTRIDSLRKQQLIRVPEPPELWGEFTSADRSENWPERGGQLMP
jgi:hypothetical protein